MNIADFEKTICKLSREPDKTLLLLKAVEQQRFMDGKEAGQQAGSQWTKGVPEHKRGCFLLKVRPSGGIALHIIKGFYVSADTPLDPGFYEDAALYAEKGICYPVPEKDIVEWQYLPEV